MKAGEEKLRRATGSPSQRRRPRQTGATWQAVGCAVALFALVLALYGQTAWFAFVNFDDPDYVTNNPLVRDGFSAKGVWRALTALDAANWHPLTWMSHMADYQLFGVNPAGHHLTNVLLHGLNAALLCLVLWQMTRPRDDLPGATSEELGRAEAWAVGQSAWVAAIFALHPLRVESVAWVSERKDVLAGTFWMLAIAAYAWHARQPARGRYLGVVMLFALGLMAKPTVVTLPIVLLLLDYWPLGRLALGARRLLIEKLPLFALSAASSAITVVAQRRGGTVTQLDLVPLTVRIENATIAYVDYLRDMFWPTGLTCFYPMEFLVTGETSSARFVGCLAVLVVVTIGVLVRARQMPYLLVGWLWYLVVLLPMIGLVQVGEQARADRYTYLASIGPAIMLAWGLPAICATWRWRGAALAVGGVTVAAALAATTWFQIGTWRDSEALWRHAIAVTDHNYSAENFWGLDLYERRQFDEALEHFQRAAVDIAVLRTSAMRTAAVRYNQAMCWNEKAKVAAGHGNAADALAFYQRAIELQPGLIDAYFAMARLWQDQNRHDEAIDVLRGLVKVDPTNALSHATLAQHLLAAGHEAEATEQFREALRLQPQLDAMQDNLSWANNLAWLLATNRDSQLRNGPEALRWATQVNDAAGDRRGEFLDTLAAAYAENRRFDEAVKAAEAFIAHATAASRKARDPAVRKQLEQAIAESRDRLRRYQSAQPYHVE